MTADEPRLGPLPVDRWDEDVLEALRTGRSTLLAPELREALDAEDVARLAEILPNAVTTLLRHPALAGRFLAVTGSLLSDAALPARWRELMVLRVAWRTGCNYVWLQHVRIAPRYGVAAEEVAAVPEGPGAGAWEPVEAALLAATDQLLDRHGIEAPTWARLAAALDERQLVELPLLVGTYLTQALAYNSFAVQLDPSLREVEAPVVPPGPD